MPCVQRLQAHRCEPLKTAPWRLQDDVRCVTRHMGDVRMYNILDLSRSNYVKFQDLLVDLHI